MEPGQILANDVKLDVDAGSGTEGVEVRVLVGVRDDCHAERIALGVADRQAAAVDRHGAFLHGDISFGGHRRVYFVTEFVVAASVNFLDAFNYGGAIHMPLDDMAVQTSVEHHGALEVDFRSLGQVTEIGALERLADGGDGVG